MTWLRALDLLLQLLNKLVNYIAEKKREKEGNDAQQEADKINANPVDAFNDHFNNRVRSQESLQSSDSGKTVDKH